MSSAGEVPGFEPPFPFEAESLSGADLIDVQFFMK
jgi:hypothetical protein